MKEYDLKPDHNCPECKSGVLFDPEKSLTPELPPTGGDYEFADSSVTLQCNNCGSSIKSTYKRRYWLDTGKVTYVEY